VVFEDDPAPGNQSMIIADGRQVQTRDNERVLLGMMPLRQNRPR
jgi:hypothetical protein